MFHLIHRALSIPLATPLDPEQKADAIVILGAPMKADGSLTIVAEERVAIGVELYRRGLAEVVCVAGGHCPRGTWNVEAEAEGMARFVRAAGVPESAIRVDRKSRSTIENAMRSAEILLREGRRKVWLVTQPFHLKRAAICFRRAGFEPLLWSVPGPGGGVEGENPRVAVRWVLREYAAFALLGGRVALSRLALGRPPPLSRRGGE